MSLIHTIRRIITFVAFDSKFAAPTTKFFLLTSFGLNTADKSFSRKHCSSSS